MYLLFLTVGAVVGAAGVILAISGLSLRDGTFDAAVFTPGIVTAIGGFLVVGLGVGLRTLQRIEQALASRPTLRASLSAATADTAETGDVPFFLPPIAIAAANEVNPDSDASVGKQGHETAAPQLPMGMRSATLTERPSGPTFDSLWPKSPRPGPSAPSPPASTQAPAVSAADSQQSTDQSIDVASQASGGGGSMPVSIVKSGVVNGMAYILYSDGSIEAQLPQGTLRFGSIIELRNHIEHSA